jgi:hypothetical protein
MTYKIVRFHMHGPSEVVETGLSLREAQLHCQDPETRGDAWFDGYEKEEREE